VARPHREARISVTGAAAFARVAVQRELTDDECAPAHIHTERFSLPSSSSKMRNVAILLANHCASAFRVARADADEEHQPVPNCTGERCLLH